MIVDQTEKEAPSQLMGESPNERASSTQQRSSPRPDGVEVVRTLSENPMEGVQVEPSHEKNAAVGLLEDSQDTLESYDRQMILNTDLTSYKRKFLGGGTLQALAKYLDSFFEKKGLQSINSKFPFGMQHAEEMPLPNFFDGPNLPPLPEWAEIQSYIAIFEQTIYPFYPILDLASFRVEAKRLASQNPKAVTNHDIPLLSSLYSVLGLAVDEKAKRYTQAGMKFLTAAYGFLAYLTSMPYLSSVQATALLSVGLRARNKDGSARQTLGQAIRIAQSIGLHHSFEGIAVTPGQTSYEPDYDLDSRVWWTCYCLEMTMSLEVGRPAAFRDSDCTQIIPPISGAGEQFKRDFSSMVAGLGQIQCRLIDIIYHRPPQRRNASSLLHDIGSADQWLCEWAASVPQDIR
jgi:hypothetical protein